MVDRNDNIFFIFGEGSFKFSLAVQVLDEFHLGSVVLTIIGLEGGDILFILVCREEGASEPRTLVVFDVGADLADVSRIAEAVEEVVLDLEILTHRDGQLFDESGVDAFELVGDGETEDHGAVICVEGSLVLDDAVVSVESEFLEVGCVGALLIGDELGGVVDGSGVVELTDGGEEVGFVDGGEEDGLVGMPPEEDLDHASAPSQDDQTVVDGDSGGDTLHFVPARFAAASQTTIHNVVLDEEVSLQKLNAPAKNASSKNDFVLLLLGLVGVVELGAGSSDFDDANTAVVLSAEAVRIHALLQVAFAVLVDFCVVF